MIPFCFEYDKERLMMGRLEVNDLRRCSHAFPPPMSKMTTSERAEVTREIDEIHDCL